MDFKKKGLWQAFLGLVSERGYRLALLLTALFAYGYEVTHPGIGMDDTAVGLYFEEGLAPYVGRWTIFFLNKAFRLHISRFDPWVTDLAGVFLLMVSVTLWCALWKSVLDRWIVLPVHCYAITAAVFLSCPIISEVYIYQLHNGIGIGYGLTALSLSLYMGGVEASGKIGRRAYLFMLSTVLLTIAVGCYESFLVLFVLGAILVFGFTRTQEENKQYGGKDIAERSFFTWLLGGVLVTAGCLLLREAALWGMKFFYSTDALSGYDVLYRKLFGDNFTALSELGMTLKRYVSLYYLHGLMYLPITLLVFSRWFLVGYLVVRGIQKKDIFPLFCGVLIIAIPAVMAVVEGNVTKYRSAQYVPMVIAFAVLLLQSLFQTRSPRWRTILSALFCILIFRQCVDMNHWFYLDYMKYCDARDAAERVAMDIRSGCDVSKPIVFVGAYSVPANIASEACVSYGSRPFRWICRLTDHVDAHWKEKYYHSQGYCYLETPIISILQWGSDAFNHTGGQIIEFMRMHGDTGFYCAADQELIAQARADAEALALPGYPGEGYVCEREEYILVNLEHN